MTQNKTSPVTEITTDPPTFENPAPTNDLGMLSSIIKAEEELRQNLAQDLHDDVGSSLTTLLLGLQSLEKKCTSEEAAAEARDLCALARRTIDSLQSLYTGLHARHLKEAGFGASLKSLCRTFEKWHEPDIDLVITGLGDNENLEETLEVALYRILQELLHNVHKHARATRIDVILNKTKHHLSMIVEDNGQGLEAPSRANSGSRIGMQGLEQRVRLLTGELKVETNSDRGTTIFIKIPLGHNFDEKT